MLKMTLALAVARSFLTSTSSAVSCVIALGGGATAALGAFDWLIRQQG